jgi:hypothetical protein
MGQYQEWLLAQEIDRRLKSEVEALETEILYLKDRVTILEQTVPETENIILQALLAYLRSQAQNQDTASKSESTAPVQVNWSGLPRLETPQAVAAGSVPYSSGTYARLERWSEDMLAFFEERRQTDPGLSSWSQRKQRRENEEHPVDAETRRLNENIQRWFDRWHREISSVAQPEVQDGE